jgi:hypothetical protein
MVAKTMVQQKNCQGCSQEHNCRMIFEKLAEVKGRSVIFKVSLAFLLPIIVFITSLAVFQQTLAEMIVAEMPYGSAKRLLTILSFLLALSVTFAVVLIIKVINKQFGKISSSEKSQV